MGKSAQARLFGFLVAWCLLLSSCAGVRPFTLKKPGDATEPRSRAQETRLDSAGPAEPGSNEEADKNGSEETEDVTFLSEIEQGESSEGVCGPVLIETNDKVKFFLDYFQGPKKGWMSRALQRSGRYSALMKQILREEGLPEDLFYLALIESGYNPYAYSSAGAVGIWQFMAETGMRYGLRVDWWIDERRDPEKSTRAAARYLKDLYTQFGDWYLAAAAYNAGEKRIQKAIDTCESNDFWHLSRNTNLKGETKDYVPKFLAALMIAKDPEKYGFGPIAYDPPLLYETVEVPEPLDITTLARICGHPAFLLRSLNPQINRPYTPARCEIRVPQGSAATFRANYAKLTPEDRVSFRRHVVRKGENLAGIARKYGVPASTIVEMNDLPPGNKLRGGTALTIPVVQASAEKISGPEREQVSPSVDKTSGTPRSSESPRRQAEARARYEVRRGDTLWKISQKHGVSLQDLCAWNGLKPSSPIHPGQVLTVCLAGAAEPAVTISSSPPQPQSVSTNPARAKSGGLKSEPETASLYSGQAAQAPAEQTTARVSPSPNGIYQVQRGDTLWKISQEHGVSLQDLCAWNGMRPSSRIHPGQAILVRRLEPKSTPARATASSASSRSLVAAQARSEASPQREMFWHVVQEGETLWKISRKYGVTPAELSAWNDLDVDTILVPGTVLKVYTERDRYADMDSYPSGTLKD
jgi:membrane-bound lytic murein transglycosylase D